MIFSPTVRLVTYSAGGVRCGTELRLFSKSERSRRREGCACFECLSRRHSSANNCRPNVDERRWWRSRVSLRNCSRILRHAGPELVLVVLRLPCVCSTPSIWISSMRTSRNQETTDGNIERHPSNELVVKHVLMRRAQCECGWQTEERPS